MVMDSTTDIPEAALTLVRFYRPRVVRQVRAVPRGRNLAAADSRARLLRSRHRADLDQIFEVGESICPGDMPHALGALGLEATPFPYKMTTICFVGPSAYAPLHSALDAVPRRVRGQVVRPEAIPSPLQ